MNNFKHFFLDYSEVWALLIPLLVILFKKNYKHPYLKPIRIYLWITLVLNIAIVLISEHKKDLGIEKGDFLWSNNFIYNIQSLVRLLSFAWFFVLLKQHFMHRVKKIIPVLFIVFVIINFSFYEDFFPQGSFSSRLLATEAALLLFYCLQYFIFLMIEENSVKLVNQPGFWIVTGLSIYVSVNFFIFLFYSYLSDAIINFAINIWDVHNITFIILCCFIAKQLYKKNV